ncbi:hypothetical protein MSG28_007214 [Choristoneura fumiferana]|uniref:Uncharacterized protein n=1 Tax=Choristoneura fumiferana TaxID=7141 RepID=A0ACC0JN31_CHOFU|nr:hypothetical protein MSG28_007214 [Choristoneura fumiferana]
MDSACPISYCQRTRIVKSTWLFVCERHFEKHLFYNGGKRLVRAAVPTLNLPQPGDPPYSAAPPRPAPLHSVTQKRTHGGAEPGNGSPPDGPDDPIKRERLTEDEASTATTGWLADLTKLLELSKAHLEPELASYIESKVLLQAQARGEEFDENLSLFGLKLYQSFPNTYKLMVKPLGLPSMVHIRRLFQPLRGDVNPMWTQLLSARFSGAAPAARACVLCVARAPLRHALTYNARLDRVLGLAAGRLPRPARYAAVLLARGLHRPWRQPLACRLLPVRPNPVEVRLWIDHVVSQLFDMGLKVHALVTDFDDGFVPTGPTVTAEKPYFMADGEKVYCFYDHTQMTISLRDHLMKYNIKFEDQTASWEVIEELHEYNKNTEHPLPTGLTDDHLNPPEEADTGRRARLAAEVLARPAADAISAAAGLGLLGHAAARGTARLARTVADLADIMRKELGGGVDAYVGDVKSLRGIIRHLNRMSLASKETGEVLPDPGLLAALRAGACGALALAERARVDGSMWPMAALNNDPLHELFDRLRARCGRESPTGQQMLTAFERSFAFNAMKSFASREDGRFEEFLNKASAMRDVWPGRPAAVRPALPPAQWAALVRAMRGRRRGRLLVRQLLARCLALHPGCAPAAAFCRSESLPRDLLLYTRLMTRKFHTHFADLICVKAGLVESLLKLMKGQCFEAPCACFPMRQLKIMFCRYNIHTLLEFNNARFATGPDAEFSLLREIVDFSDDDDDDEDDDDEK